jgi:hypothetical protein
MAKEGNRSMGPKHEVSGPCSDCGHNEGTFTPVRRYRTSGKGVMVKLCQKCAPKA